MSLCVLGGQRTSDTSIRGIIRFGVKSLRRSHRSLLPIHLFPVTRAILEVFTCGLERESEGPKRTFGKLYLSSTWTITTMDPSHGRFSDAEPLVAGVSSTWYSFSRAQVEHHLEVRPCCRATHLHPLIFFLVSQRHSLGPH